MAFAGLAIFVAQMRKTGRETRLVAFQPLKPSHSHPQRQRTESLSRNFVNNSLHSAHDLIHMNSCEASLSNTISSHLRDTDDVRNEGPELHRNTGTVVAREQAGANLVP